MQEPKKRKEVSPCDKCPFQGRVQVAYSVGSEYARGVGSSKKTILILGMEPGRQEEAEGKPFVGRSGEYLWNSLSEVGIYRESVAVLNARKCQHIDSDSDEAQSKASRCCRGYLSEALRELQPSVVLALGDIAVRQILRIAGGKRVSDLQGHWLWTEEFKTWVLVNTHPAFVLRKGGFGKPADTSFRETCSKLLFRQAETTQFGVVKVKSLLPLLSEIEASECVCYDVETYSQGHVSSPLNWWHESLRVRCVSISYRENQGLVLLDDGSGNSIRELLKVLSVAKKSVGHNASFYDDRCLEAVAGKSIPLKRGQMRHDSLLAAHLVDENRSNSLENLAYTYAESMAGYDAEFNSKFDKDRMDEIPEEDLIPYSGGDAVCGLRVWEGLKKEILSTGRVARVYSRLSLPASKVVSRMMARGLVFNSEVAEEVRERFSAKVEEMDAQCLIDIPAKVRKKHAGALSLTRDALIVDILFSGIGYGLIPACRTEKKGTPSVARNALAKLGDPYFRNNKKPPAKFEQAKAWVAQYLEVEEYRKAISSYIDGFLKYSQNGRIYPTYSFTRAVTGRTACERPAFQQLPSRKPYSKDLRSIFKAPPGCVIVCADYKQIELLVAAWLAGENAILDAFKAGVDLHTQTASELLGIPMTDVTKTQRSGAKACIAQGELVLTDQGEVPIEKVTKDMFVWDGVEWVSHDGAVFQGEREVMYYDGLWATPDHEVFLEGGSSARHETAKQRGIRLAVGTPVQERGPSSRMGEQRRESKRDTRDGLRDTTSIWRYSWNRLIPTNTRTVQRMWSAVSGVCESYFKQKNKNLQMYAVKKVSKRPKNSYAWEQVQERAKKVYGPIIQKLEQIWRKRNKNAFFYKGGVHNLDAFKSTTPNIQKYTNRQSGQQRELRTGESSISNSKRELKQQVKLSKVYDILNCGKRHRFTVSGKIVSNCNFGFLYGAQSEGFREYAKSNYGLELTSDQAEDFRNKFFKIRPRLLEWHRDQIRFARKYGFSESPIGRRRHLPDIDSDEFYKRLEAERQAINAPVQSFGSSDLGMMAAINLDTLTDKGIWLAGFTHDSWMFYVEKTGGLKKKLALIKETMEHPPLKELFDIEMPFTPLVDMTSGPNLRDQNLL